jgi:hypothetical protein
MAEVTRKVYGVTPRVLCTFVNYFSPGRVVLASSKKLKSVSDLIRNLKSDLNDGWGPAWYRGQANLSWKLLPGYDRLENPISETELVNKFRQNASFLMDKMSPSNDFEWLFMMQH